MESLVYYNKKDAKIKKKDNEIIAAYTLKHYIILSNYHTFLEYIQHTHVKNFYEYLPPNTPLNLFFDIEIYRNAQLDNTQQDYFTEYNGLLQLLKKTINNLTFLKTFNKKFIILESHNQEKKSFHVIVRLTDSSGVEWYFKDSSTLKKLYHNMNLKRFVSGKNAHIFDPAVYRDGLFRTIYSSKEGENRSLEKSEHSDDFNDIETFVMYTTNTNIIKIDSTILQQVSSNVVNIDKELDKSTITFIIQTISNLYKVHINSIGIPFIDHEKGYIITPSDSKYCNNIQREHKSNHQFFILDSFSIKQKCHDPECNTFKYNEIRIDTLGSDFIHRLDKFIQFNQNDIDKIDNALDDTRKFLQMLDNNISPKSITYNQLDKSFKTPLTESSSITLTGKCKICKAYHIICINGYYIECDVCKTRLPIDGYLPLPTNNYLSMFYTQINIQNNIIINNNEDLCLDIELHPDIYTDQDFTNLVCNALEKMKIQQLGVIFSKLYKDISYADDNWYYFNGIYWILDKRETFLSDKVMFILSECFQKIVVFYNKDPEQKKLVNSVKKIISDIQNPRITSSIIVTMRESHRIPNFMLLLDSKIDLIPFTNGVFDIQKNKFRAALKEDYIQTTLDFPYDSTVDTTPVYNFISSIIPDTNVLYYLLKNLSLCLNGYTSNELFHILNGNGSNGKSLLINLVRHTFGDFSFKPDISLITRDRTESSSATPQKALLYKKRFAYFTEPNYNDKFNSGLLKELTGNEEITARGLHKDPFKFQFRCKLYLACNSIPKIEGDAAISRRFRIINFNTKFVDNPTLPHERKKDPSMNELVTTFEFKMGFMNILLDYYYKPVQTIPTSVLECTRRYMDDNQAVVTWCQDNLGYHLDNILTISDIYKVYKTDRYIDMDSFTILFNGYIDTIPYGKYGRYNVNGHSIKRERGYKHINFIDDIPTLL